MFLQNFLIFIAASVSICDLLTDAVKFFQIFVLFSRNSQKNLGKVDQNPTKLDQIAKMDFSSASLSTFDTKYLLDETETLNTVINIWKACFTNFLKKKSDSWATFFAFFLKYFENNGFSIFSRQK